MKNQEENNEDLMKMIARFFEPDSFEGVTSLNCDFCRKKSLLTTQMTELTKLPPYLVISLNRFYFDEGEQRGSKILTFVDIYPYIDFKDILKYQVSAQNTQYQLYAIIVHKVTFFF